MDFRQPKHIQPLKETTKFDASKHLALQEPERVYSLTDFGYSPEQAQNAHFPIAVTTPFRLLSSEGLQAAREAVKNLVQLRRKSERMANFVRGSIFYSPFLRDLCLNEQLNEFISHLAGQSVLPHPMALYQGHLNLKPEEQGREVDRWHTDTVVLDFVLLLTDPSTFEGGYFEYFQATKSQAIRSLIREEDTPNIIKVAFPEAGWAVLQQGNMVVHRASAVTKGDERTTLVQSFVSDDPNFIDVSKLDDCKPVDPHDILFSEWARYKAFLSKRRLEKLIEEIPYTEDKNQICNELRKAIRDVEEAILEISDPSSGRLLHLGQDALTDLL